MAAYKAGNIKNYLGNWEKITSDNVILDIIENGLKIEFLGSPPTSRPYRLKFSEKEENFISAEIDKLVKKGVIQECNITSDSYFSSIFLRPKKDNSFRFILNLKELNKHIFSPHFKMESVHMAKDMLRKNMWMASIDLKDAYYSVPIHKDYQKYLKFLWDKPYKFLALPNGYSPAMLKFTKLLKPVFATLRELSYLQ